MSQEMFRDVYIIIERVMLYLNFSTTFPAITGEEEKIKQLLSKFDQQ